MSRSHSKRMRPLAVLAVTVALLAIPASYVWGSHLFPDVSSSAFYHDSVSAIFNAGVSSGFPDGTYKPNSAVTRGQMAVFLDKLGGLSLGPGGQPHPVVDALSVQGTQSYRFFQNVSFTNADPTECSPDITVGPKAANFGSYSLTLRLYQTPAGVNPEGVNVQIRDVDDPAPDDYQICFARIDGNPLPDGTYRLFGTQMVFNGQLKFAG